MSAVLIAVLIMTGLGLFFAAVLAVAQRFLRVEEDPRLEQVTEMLPGSNCGACSAPGCAAFAERLIDGEAQPGACTVADARTHEAIATFLGVDVGATDKRIARLKCAGGEGLVGELAEYRGRRSCTSAFLVDGGGRACTWGCLGLGDCEEACGFDAITMSRARLPEVTADLCTACGDCVDVCPVDLFVLVPRDQQLFVACNSPLAGEEARSRCVVACDACGRCAADAPPGAIEMKGGLPVIHWDAPEPPGPKATWRCPTGAIVWIDEESQEVAHG